MTIVQLGSVSLQIEQEATRHRFVGKLREHSKLRSVCFCGVSGMSGVIQKTYLRQRHDAGHVGRSMHGTSGEMGTTGGIWTPDGGECGYGYRNWSALVRDMWRSGFRRYAVDSGSGMTWQKRCGSVADGG